MPVPATPEVAALKDQACELLPRVKITDLLQEVDRWTGFSESFTHHRNGRPAGLSALSGVRRVTGKEQMVQVHHDEGVAIRIGPAPCAVAREGVGYNSSALEPLSHEETQMGQFAR